MRARLSLSLILVAVPLAVGACSVSANRTVSPETVADQAAGALEREVGSRPELDCGDDQVDLVDGTVVDCVLTDPATTTQFDATVTIGDVDGSKYTVDVQVAQTPRE